MAEPVQVIETADPLIVAETRKGADAHVQVAAAATAGATAHQQIAASQQAMVQNGQRCAVAMEKIAGIEEKPYPDHEVWLTFARIRAGLNDSIARSVPEVVKFADLMLVEYKKKYPRI